MTPRGDGTLSRPHAAPVRVLVLTARTGGGHDARAVAFRDWAARLHGDGIVVRIEHALEQASAWNARGVALYNAIQRRAPWFHHLYYNVGEVFGALQGNALRVGRAYYEAVLEEFRPDVVLSVHSMLNRAHFAEAKRRLGPNVFCVTYCGEFAGGYGFSRHWVAPDVDLFLGRSEATLAAACAAGLPADKARCLGQLLKPAFSEPPMSEDRKRAYLAETLDLDPDRFTLLLATGGAAAQNHETLLDALKPLGRRVQVIALCGRSAPARARLEAWRRAHPEPRLAILSFSDGMAELLQVASAVVTRPGTTTSAEALSLGCPLVFNRIGGAMPQELCTLRFFRERDLAVEIASARALGPLIETWIEQPLTYRRHRERFRAVHLPDDPAALVGGVLGARMPETAAERRYGEPTP